uniref:Putative secreted protein n=1 Tax=Anopheles darlingi TaxID=43151 RepID=A0A2M4D598_ANODA
MQPFLRFLLLPCTVLCRLVYFACDPDGVSHESRREGAPKVTQKDISVRMQVGFLSICTEMCEPGNETYFSFPSETKAVNTATHA